MNTVSITGTVRWQPNVNETKTGTKVASLTLVLEDDQRESPSNIKVSAFGDLASLLEQYNEDDYLQVDGYLFESRWKDKRTDEWKREVGVRAQSVKTLAAATFATSGVADNDIPF